MTDSRTRLIGKVHVAKKQLAVEEGAYRALLTRVTGKTSCSVMSEAELIRVIEEFKRLGFSDLPKPAKRAGGRAQAMAGTARKIRALWLSLYHLGEIQDSSEAALAAFVERTTGVEALQWIDGVQADAVIKALRGWLDRIGLPRVDAMAMRAIDRARDQAQLPHLGEGHAAKCWLIWFQWSKLGALARQTMTLEEWLTRYFHGVTKTALLTPAQADQAIERLGRLIRAGKANQQDERRNGDG